MQFDSVSLTRSYEQIVTQIEERIRDGRLPRGTKLPTERELAGTFSVSRSVVREAIKVLDAMGLVTSRQGSGLYVRNDPIPVVTRAFTLSVSPNAESVERLFEFRQGLESDSARLAAIRASNEQINAMTSTLYRLGDTDDWDLFSEVDTRFHELIAGASGNPYLEVAIAIVRDMQRDIVSVFAEKAGAMEEAMVHHHAVLEAIRSGNAEAAAGRMREHIQYTLGVVQPHIADSEQGSRERSRV